MAKLLLTIGFLGGLATIWILWLGPTQLGGQAGYILVSGTSMLPNYHTGDLVITQQAADYEVGDVVAYRVPEPNMAAGARIIHRVIGGNGEDGYILQGDNRQTPDSWRPKQGDVIGREWLFLPGKAKYLEALRTREALIVLASLAFGFGFIGSKKPARRAPSASLLMTRSH